METNFHTYTSYPLYSPILSNFIAPPTPYEWSPADEGGPLVAFTKSVQWWKPKPTMTGDGFNNTHENAEIGMIYS